MPDDRKSHVFVPWPPRIEPFASPGSGGRSPPLPARPPDHGRMLLGRLEAAWRETIERRTAPDALVLGAPRGLLVSVRGEPGFEVALDRLDLPGHGIELRSTNTVAGIQVANVFIPEGEVGYFLGRFEEYLSRRTDAGHPVHRGLVESISEIRLMTLEAMWTEPAAPFPAMDQPAWLEVWVRSPGGDRAGLDRLRSYARQRGLETRDDEILAFPDRLVALVRAAPADLTHSVDLLNDLAELRLAKFPVSRVLDLPVWEQAPLVRDLAERLVPPPADAPAVCVLDTGVTRMHPVLVRALDERDTLTCNRAWGVHDHKGHGTGMAGLALIGDHADHLAGSGEVVATHRLESVKILPPAGANPEHSFGAITAACVARAEVENPARQRVVLLATSTSDCDLGRPSSWSAEVDRLASGVDEGGQGERRLFVLAAGNAAVPRTDDYFGEHLAGAAGIEEPGQAWNALTVGASTERITIPRGEFAGWTPVAACGDLAPHSRTSLAWLAQARNSTPFRGAPLKPDVVAEGGNVARSPGGTFDWVDDLCLVTCHHRIESKLLAAMNGTSAAAALVARMAAAVQAAYPRAWPETVRALIVHSARWTPAMRGRLEELVTRSRVLDVASGPGPWHVIPARIQGQPVLQGSKESFLRCFGFGVPDVGRAIESAANRLTLVVQQAIDPFDGDRFKEIHLHRLPWPQDVLMGLGATPVVMRVTLSYFVEPDPARRGFKSRFQYQSYGLRFDVKTPTEDEEEFHRRLNREAQAEEDEEASTSSDSASWCLGRQLRTRGSLHCDIWEGTAAELAARGVVAVYPVVGWWRGREDLRAHKARYSLVVTIETPAVEADVWTPVANQVRIAVPV
ncbi:MAG: S8 family peptidase [Deltaproteobacteria bacterium]|nr:S8 family peptidase [Deltaproteobacteria bacterium]